MFHYLGRKSDRFAKIYPEPKYNTIIEPFAGSAGYALHHYSKKVILCENSEANWLPFKPLFEQWQKKKFNTEFMYHKINKKRF